MYHYVQQSCLAIAVVLCIFMQTHWYDELVRPHQIIVAIALFIFAMIGLTIICIRPDRPRKKKKP